MKHGVLECFLGEFNAWKSIEHGMKEGEARREEDEKPLNYFHHHNLYD